MEVPRTGYGPPAGAVEKPPEAVRKEPAPEPKASAALQAETKPEQAPEKPREADEAERRRRREEAVRALERLAERAAFRNTSLRFHVDEETSRIVVEVVDEATREVIRQIPAKEVLDALLRLDEPKGGRLDAVG